jgi:hypothetical protein
VATFGTFFFSNKKDGFLFATTFSCDYSSFRPVFFSFWWFLNLCLFRFCFFLFLIRFSTFMIFKGLLRDCLRMTSFPSPVYGHSSPLQFIELPQFPLLSFLSSTITPWSLLSKKIIRILKGFSKRPIQEIFKDALKILIITIMYHQLRVIGNLTRELSEYLFILFDWPRHIRLSGARAPTCPFMDNLCEYQFKHDFPFF